MAGRVCAGGFVRDFGTVNAALFPESSPGAGKFVRVSAAVDAIDEHLKNRVLGKAGARGVKATTRAAVVSYMKTIAKAARRVTVQERNVNPFRMPRRRTLKVEVATARAFLEEAEQRQELFMGIGLPQTFISDFRALVHELSEAVDTRLNSKTLRAQAQAGIAAAVRQGLDVARDLDVVLEIAAQQNPVLAAMWRSARRIEGQGTSPAPVKPTPEVEPVGTVEPTAPPVGAEVLEKAS